jgi:hypothetical protein
MPKYAEHAFESSILMQPSCNSLEYLEKYFGALEQVNLSLGTGRRRFRIARNRPGEKRSKRHSHVNHPAHHPLRAPANPLNARGWAGRARVLLMPSNMKDQKGRDG